MGQRRVVSVKAEQTVGRTAPLPEVAATEVLTEYERIDRYWADKLGYGALNTTVVIPEE